MFHSFPEKLYSVRGAYPNAANGLVSAMVGAFGSPAIDILLVPMLDMEEAGLEKVLFFIFCGRRGCDPLL